jgi:hypothetical protein
VAPGRQQAQAEARADAQAPVDVRDELKEAGA